LYWLPHTCCQRYGFLTLTPAHHLFALKAIHALNRAIAAIGKILLTDMHPFGCVIGRVRLPVGACWSPRFTAKQIGLTRFAGVNPR
jgi:hypothetical protein